MSTIWYATNQPLNSIPHPVKTHTQSFHLKKRRPCLFFISSQPSLWTLQITTQHCSLQFLSSAMEWPHHCSIPESLLSLGYSPWAMPLIGHFVREEWGRNGNKMVRSHLFRGHHCSHQHLNPTEVQFQFPVSTMGKAVLTTHISLCQNISLTRQSVDSWRAISPTSSSGAFFPLF